MLQDTPHEVQDFKMHNGAMLHLIVFTNASGHTWPHPTRSLGVVSGATDLNLSTHRGQYHNLDSICNHLELLISNLGGIFTAQHCAGSEQFFNLLVHPKYFDDLNLKLSLISWPCRHMLGDQVFILTSFVLLLTLSDCVLYLTVIRLNWDNHLLLVQSSSKLSSVLLDILQRS